MAKINKIIGRQILDSRGNPTLEVEIWLENDVNAIASVPSGASTGKKEAVELRSWENKKVLQGKSVYKAIEKIKSLEETLKKEEFNNIITFDKFLIELDGTENKSNLGGNVTLALSLAFAKAMAKKNKKELFEYVRGEFDNAKDYKIPTPLFNFLNGGVHADNNLSIQEYFLIPIGTGSFKDNLFRSLEVFYTLKKLLKEKGKNILVGDEGGFAPSLFQEKKEEFANVQSFADVLQNDEEALAFLKKAVKEAQFTLGVDFALGVDCAASQLFHNNGYCFFKTNNKILPYTDMILIYKSWITEYNIIIIEDPFDEEDYKAWQEFTMKIGDKITIVGDDIYCTNIKYLKEGITNSYSNAILIKPNQVGTIYETFLTVKLAKEHNFKTVFSHRSGETEDIWAPHLAVAFNTDYVKFGGLSRSERLAKYNELLRIEEKLQTKGEY